MKEIEEIKKANSKSAKQKELELKYLKDFATISKLDKDDIASFGFKEEEIKTLISVYTANENSIEALYNLALINFKVENYDKSLEFLASVLTTGQEKCVSKKVIHFFNSIPSTRSDLLSNIKRGLPLSSPVMLL